MTLIAPVPNLDDLIRRYREGESVNRLAPECGVSGPTLRRWLAEAGVEIRTRAPRWDPDVPALVAAYRGGDSVLALAHRHGVDRNAVTRQLRRAGVKLRGASAAQVVRYAGSTPEERQAIVAAAHEAVRGKPLAPGHREKIAATREQRGEVLSHSGERLLRDWLADRGVVGTLQQAVGPYNADLGAFPVAVEIFGGNWHGNGRHRARFRKRADYFLDRGWWIVVVWASQRRVLTEGAADYVVATLEIARRNPSGRGQHRVIWGDGEEASTCGEDLDKATDVPATHRRLYAPGSEIPVGLCQCGCGGATRRSDRDAPTQGIRHGDFRRFISGHNNAGPSRQTAGV